jgi:FkbM family methyltransferase
MGWGEQVECLIRERRRRRLHADKGPHGAFYRSGGNELLFEGLPLGPEDVVIDAGGYRGEWTDEILCRYGCRSIILEPVPSFAERLTSRYRNNSRVEVVAAALGRANGTVGLTLAENSSTITGAGMDLQVPLIDVTEFIDARQLEEVGCMKLNIEGGEYDVLERLAEAELLGRVRCFLIQFHNLSEESERRRQQICMQLSQQHSIIFQFPFVWECWRRRGSKVS